MNETLRRSWAVALTAVMALLYIWIGLSAQDNDRILGVVGGLLMLAALVMAPHSRAAALATLALGALPLAAATWWSVITPVLMLLALLLGVFAIRNLSAPVLGRTPRTIPGQFPEFELLPDA